MMISPFVSCCWVVAAFVYAGPFTGKISVIIVFALTLLVMVSADHKVLLIDTLIREAHGLRQCIYETMPAHFPLPSLFVLYAHLTSIRSVPRTSTSVANTRAFAVIGPARWNNSLL